MPAAIISGFALGLSVGAYCFLTCGFNLAGLLASGPGREGLGRRALLYFLGRLLVYALIAVLFSLFTTGFEQVLRHLRQPLYILTGLYLVLLAGSGKNCPAQKPVSAFFLGFLNAVQPCPPFFALLASGLASGGGSNTVVLFLSFYVASSLVLLPALIPGLFAKAAFVKSLARLALSSAAAVFLFLGFHGLLPAAAGGTFGDPVFLHYFKWAAVLVFAAGAIVPVFLKNAGFALILRILSVPVFGIAAGFWISANDLTGLLHGSESFAFLSPLLVLTGFGFVSSFMDRNLFCESICPFGAFSEAGHTLCVRLKVKVYDTKPKILAPLRYLVLGLFVLFFLIPGRPFGWEPFGPLFRPASSWLAAGLAVLTLALSILDRRFYCKYLCAAGAGLDILPALRRAVTSGGHPEKSVDRPSGT